MKSYFAIPLTLLLTATILYLTFSNSLLTAITLSSISAFLLSPIGIYSVMAVAVALFCFWNMQSYKRPINEERLIAKILDMIKEKGLSSADINSSSKDLHGDRNKTPEGMIMQRQNASSKDMESSPDTHRGSKKAALQEMLMKQQSASSADIDSSSYVHRDIKKAALQEMLMKQQSASKSPDTPPSSNNDVSQESTTKTIATTGQMSFKEQIQNFQFKQKTPRAENKPSCSKTFVKILENSDVFQRFSKANGHNTGTDDYDSDKENSFDM